MSDSQQYTSKDLAFDAVEAVHEASLEFARIGAESGGTKIGLPAKAAIKSTAMLFNATEAFTDYQSAPDGKKWQAAGVSLGANTMGDEIGGLFGTAATAGLLAVGVSTGVAEVLGIFAAVGVAIGSSAVLNSVGQKAFVYNTGSGELDWGSDYHVKLNADNSLTFRLNGGAQMTVHYDTDGNVTDSISKAPSGDSVELQQDGTIIARNAAGNIVASGLVTDPNIDPVLIAHLDAMGNSMDQFFTSQGIPLTTDQITQNLTSPNAKILANQSGDTSAIMHDGIRYTINSDTGAKTVSGNNIMATKYPDGSASYSYIDPVSGKMISLAQGSDGHSKLYYTDPSGTWFLTKEFDTKAELTTEELGKLNELANKVNQELKDGFGQFGIDAQGIPEGALPSGASDLGDDLAHKLTPPLPGHKPQLPGDWVTGAEGHFDAAATNSLSPLVLDLDGDGIELAALNGTGSVYWDIDKDGFREASGWITGGDGLLCIDKNSNGTIDNNGELFGNDATYANGFAALAAYDSNHDGKITSADSQFSKLRVWVDANSDGISQSAELRTLSSLGITSINTTYSAENYAIAGNSIKQESTFVINGASRKIVDAWFAYDNVNSVYDGNYTLDLRTMFLPTQRGYGKLPDLHIAMSLNESLLEKVQVLATASVTDIMDPAFNFAGKITDILYTWAGVENVNPTSRGSYIDARTLGFLEVFMGKPFVWTTPDPDSPNPGGGAVSELNAAWKAIFANIAGHLLAQSASVTELVDMNPGYDLVTDILDGGELNVFVGISGQSAIYGTDGRDIILGSNSYQSSFGYGGDDTLIGGSSGGSLWGGDGNDTLRGGAGGNGLEGEAGNDTLTGGAGMDYLTGGTGDDTFVFRTGDSAMASPDTVYETVGEGTDTIKLTGGILPANVRMWTDYNTLHIRYSSGDEVIVAAGTDATGASDVGSRVERIVFDNGTVWDLTQGLTLTDTDDAHTIYGSESGNDVIDGRGGDDYINGFGGNDTLTGGTGQDMLTGGTGDDTYVFRTGDSPIASWDMVNEAIGEGTDTIKLTGGILPSSVRMWSEYGALHIRYSSGDEIVVSAGSDSTGASDVGNRVERIVFDNGTVWNLANGLPLTDTDDGHISYGSAQNDVIDGRGGNDSINGFSGNDTLTGGTGQDYLTGGTGDDTFIFRVGDSPTSSPDWLYESAGEGVDTIRLTGGILPSAVTLSVSYGYLSIQYSPTDTINVLSGYDYTASEVIPYAEKVVFDNGTVWDFRNGITTSGTSAADTIHGTGLKDIINGNGGNDSLYGEGGADTLTGGAGNDLLYGGYGDDKYVYTSGTGMDTIHDDGGAADVISLGSGYTASNITLARVGQYDMAVIASGQQILLIEGQFSYNGPIETLKYGDGTSLNLLTYSHTLNGTAGNDTLYGTSYGAGGDKINGLDGNDSIYAGAGNDTVTGGNGNDYIYGEDGNDTLSGNAGDDTIYSGTGNDTVIYDSGVDVFADYGGTDTISLTNAAITAANMTLVRPAGSQADLQVLLNGTLAFTIQGQFYQGYEFETIKFANGSTFNLSTVQYTTNGTASGETLYGIGFGGNPDDIINGNGGDDYITALQGNDKITGGTGNDYIDGGEGNDTYIYNAGDGLDRIVDSSGTDTIQIGAGFVKSDLTWQRDGGTNDMNLILKGIQVMTITGQFLPGQQIETVRFADGSTQTLTGLQITTNGTDGGDSLSGLMYNASPDDIINGKGGDDYIYGYSGNDTLTGGTGNDYIDGGDGNDTFVYNSGDGLDTISDTSGTDVIRIGAGFVKADLTWKQVNTYDLALYLKGVEVMIVRDHFRDGYAVESVKFADNSTYALTGLALAINGTSGQDSLSGFNITKDTLNGNAGDDYLYGFGGDDTLNGGTGHDYLAGGTGNDTYVFKAGDSPRANPDYLVENPGEGTDTVKLTGGILPANVIMWTDYYNLHIRYSATDEINVVSGYSPTGETLIGSYVEKIVFDNGTIWSLTGGLTLTDTDDGHSILGSAGNDIIDGRGGEDYLYAYGGDDTLIGGTGHDYLAGGTGNDTYVFKAGDSPLANPDYIQENPGEGTDTIRLTGGILPANVIMWADYYSLHIRYSATDEITVTSSYDATGSLIGSYVEKIIFDNGTIWDLTGSLTLTDTDDSHFLLGSLQNDFIDGGGGDDMIYGYGGNDTLTGGTGYDNLTGGAGNDTYVFKVGDSPLTRLDHIQENVNEGTDTIKLTGGILPANVIMWADYYSLHIRYSASDEITVVSGYDATGSLVGSYVEKITFDNGTVWSLTGGLTLTDTDDTHSVIGSSQNDIIDGRGGNDSLYGYGGNDTITGGTGNDSLIGGAGDDVYKWGAGAGADRIVEESGSADKIFVLSGLTPENLTYSIISTYDLKIMSALNSADNITIDDEFYTGTPGSIVEKIEFSDGFSMVLGDYANWIKGTSAAETLNGDPGGVTRNDTMLGGAGNDAVNGLNGNDTISGDAGVDTIHGNGGSDFLHGGSGNDILYGDAGNDVLWGGLGADTVTGGAGADRFVFDSSTASSDTIKDFSKTEDILDLSHLISGFDPLTKAITDFVQITDSGANSIVKVDIDGTANGVNFVQIATLQNVTGLTDEAALMNSGHLLAA